jgi:hypothetical protein
MRIEKMERKNRRESTAIQLNHNVVLRSNAVLALPNFSCMGAWIILRNYQTGSMLACIFCKLCFYSVVGKSIT